MKVVTTLEALGVVWCLWCARELRVWSEKVVGRDHRWQQYRQDFFSQVGTSVISIHVKLKVILSSSLFYTAV